MNSKSWQVVADRSFAEVFVLWALMESETTVGLLDAGDISIEEVASAGQ